MRRLRNPGLSLLLSSQLIRANQRLRQPPPNHPDPTSLIQSAQKRRAGPASAEPAQFFARRPESPPSCGRLLGRSSFFSRSGFFSNNIAFDGDFHVSSFFSRSGFHVDFDSSSFFSRSFSSFFGASGQAQGQNGSSGDSNNLLHSISPSRTGAAVAAPDEWAWRPFTSALSAFLGSATDFVHESSTGLKRCGITATPASRLQRPQ